MQLVIDTHVRENYGAHDWDGTGECPQYWKNKGGSTYLVALGTSLRPRELMELVHQLSLRINKHDDYWHEYVTCWSVESDDFVPEDERLQLEYEGHITYPCARLDPVTGARLNPIWIPARGTDTQMTPYAEVQE